jgi:hypothetical protein
VTSRAGVAPASRDPGPPQRCPAGTRTGNQRVDHRPTDPAAGTVGIQRTATVGSDGHTVVGPTKTRAGERTSPLPTWRVERLQGIERTDVYVFPAPRAGRLSERRATDRETLRVLDAAGVPWSTTHT